MTDKQFLDALRKLGFAPEFQGGGCYMMAAYRGTAHIGITYSDGCDLPSFREWMICVSREAGEDSVAHWRSDEGRRDPLESARLAIACAEALDDEEDTHFTLTPAARDYLLRCEVEAETQGAPA
jgi:hypothetical protein